MDALGPGVDLASFPGLVSGNYGWLLREHREKSQKGVCSHGLYMHTTLEAHSPPKCLPSPEGCHRPRHFPVIAEKCAHRFASL